MFLLLAIRGCWRRDYQLPAGFEPSLEASQELSVQESRKPIACGTSSDQNDGIQISNLDQMCRGRQKTEYNGCRERPRSKSWWSLFVPVPVKETCINWWRWQQRCWQRFDFVGFSCHRLMVLYVSHIMTCRCDEWNLVDKWQSAAGLESRYAVKKSGIQLAPG